ncbi:MAG: hybrid sensor histidine kinase/response regulator [Candidatus Sumerlaeia bacterium]
MKPFNECKVLLVDDTKTNIDILVAGLKDEFKLMIALGGKAALASAKANPPDLILLDIMMPEMNGYEVLERLKADEATRNIPVIFVTAMGEEEDETRGLEMGAVDYIIKPFSMPITKARIRTHLSLEQARAELESQNEALREAARLREDVERMSRHDLKTPLTSIISGPSVIRLLGPINPDQEQVLEMISRGGYKMLDMINRSLDLYKMEVGTYQLDPKPVELLALVRQVLADTESMTKRGGMQIAIRRDGEAAGDDQKFMIRGDELLCYSMLSNLIKNAIEACPSCGRIEIDLDGAAPPRVRIANDGEVPEAIRERFFDKYTTLGKTKGTGLGTYSARLIAETQGGSIRLDTSTAGRTAVVVQLPEA